MDENKNIIISGCNTLKKMKLNDWIISEKDGLLSKKMKIRCIR
jgi:hypothetical protein